MTVSFSTSTDLIVLPTPEYGNTYEVEKRQKTGRSDGGALYVYDKGAASLYRQALAFKHLTKYEASELRTFFDTLVSGSLSTFTFTDHRGRVATARFLNTSLQFENSGADDRYNVNISLEVSAISDLSIASHPLCICNMDADVDDTGRHQIVRDGQLSYASDYYRWGTSLRCNSASPGSDMYRILYFPEDLDLTQFKRTIAFSLIRLSGISSTEPFYPIRFYVNANNYWEIRFLYSGTGNDFDVHLKTVIGGAATTEATTVTMIQEIAYHFQFEFNPYTNTHKMYQSGTLVYTFTTITAFPAFSSSATTYLKVEGDYWRVDSYAWFQGIKNGTNFTAPTGPYTP